MYDKTAALVSCAAEGVSSTRMPSEDLHQLSANESIRPALAAGPGAWVPWISVVPSLAVPQGAAFADIIVPTVDTAR